MKHSYYGLPVASGDAQILPKHFSNQKYRQLWKSSVELFKLYNEREDAGTPKNQMLWTVAFPSDHWTGKILEATIFSLSSILWFTLPYPLLWKPQTTTIPSFLLWQTSKLSPRCSWESGDPQKHWGGDHGLEGWRGWWKSLPFYSLKLTSGCHHYSSSWEWPKLATFFMLWLTSASPFPMEYPERMSLKLLSTG